MRGSPADEAISSGRAGTPQDSLARDLPGLPAAASYVRADESGLHYHGQDYSWDSLSSLTVRSETLFAEGRRLYRPSVMLFEASVVAEDARVLETAWREYVLRRIERDGALKGTAAPSRLERASRLFFLSAVLTFVLGFVVLSMALGQLGTASTRERAARGGPLLALPVTLGYVALFLLARALAAERAKRRLDRKWKSWELRADGLVLGSGADPRRLVPDRGGPDGGDTAFLECAVIDGEPVSIRDMTGRPVLASLLLAMVERRGIEPEAGEVGVLARRLSFGLASGGLVPALIGFAMGSTMTGVLALVAAVLVVGALACMSWMSHSRRRGELARILEEGREALGRLGW